MDKTYTVEEIEELLSICYEELERDLMKSADENNESESRKEELRFSLMLHITPYRLKVMEKIMIKE